MLTGYQLKLIAISAMFVDHIAWAFVDTTSMLGQIMHLFGRITAPTMCFFIAEGYRHTRSFRRYLGRLIIFAVIAQIPFSLFANGVIALYPLNMLYTLSLGLMAIYVYDRVQHKLWRGILLLTILLLSSLGDWSSLAVMFCLIFYIYRDSQQEQWMFIGITGLVMGIMSSLFNVGVVLSLPLLYLYNGERGGGYLSRWVFYVFYPVHLLMLGLLRW